MVLLTGSSPSRSITSDLGSCSLELCNTCGTAGIISSVSSRKVEIAGTLVASSVLRAPVSNSSTSNSSNRFWKTQFIQACPSVLSKCFLSVVNLADPELSTRALNPSRSFCQLCVLPDYALCCSTSRLFPCVSYPWLTVFIDIVQTVNTAH